MEAHGGYTFCGLAALEILGKSHLCNLKALLVSKMRIPDVSKPGPGWDLNPRRFLELFGPQL